LTQEALFDRSIRAGFGWVSYRLPSKDGAWVPAPEHFIDPEANTKRPWEESSRNGFVVAPFSLAHGPELWLQPWIRWQGNDPDARVVAAAAEWMDLTVSVDEPSDEHPEHHDSQHYLEFCQSVRQITEILQNKTLDAEGVHGSKALQKVVWSRTKSIQLPSEAHPCQLFEALCRTYPSLHIVLLHHPVYGIWLGSSPETLVEKNSPQIRSMALAGTRGLAHTGPWGDKEIREQRLVVDYLQACFAGKSISTDLQETTTVQKGPVEHLLNKIEGKSNISCYEMAHCLHPTPAVAGFPVQESVKYILENEPHQRSLYAGYWGYLNEEGNGLLSVNLRCLHWQGKQVRLYMGAGILPESDADTEWLETCRKSETLMNILHSLGWISPPSGIPGE
jgi:isochorismate synthase